MFKFLRRRKSSGQVETTSSVCAQPTAIDLEQLLTQLTWRVIRRLDGQLQGDYRTLFSWFWYRIG